MYHSICLRVIYNSTKLKPYLPWNQAELDSLVSHSSTPTSSTSALNKTKKPFYSPRDKPWARVHSHSIAICLVSHNDTRRHDRLLHNPSRGQRGTTKLGLGPRLGLGPGLELGLSDSLTRYCAVILSIISTIHAAPGEDLSDRGSPESDPSIRERLFVRSCAEDVNASEDGA